ncbi:MAG: tol-pal system YbgF family protein, partial [Bradymonadaceae bacterium]
AAADDQDQADESSESSGGGGGLGGKIAEARQLINGDQFAEARSVLADLRQQAPNNAEVADLHLTLASTLQVKGRKQEAKAVYRAYLEIVPSGSRADEVRSILKRL